MIINKRYLFHIDILFQLKTNIFLKLKCLMDKNSFINSILLNLLDQKQTNICKGIAMTLKLKQHEALVVF